MKRRTFIGGCACCPVFGIAQQSQGQDNLNRKYCSLDANFDLNRIRRFSTSGNVQLDRALIAELRKLLVVFPKNPGFQYFDDAQSPNALAWRKTVIPNTEGTIFFGKNLVKSELGNEFGGAAVAGIAAHEMAHIFQFFSDFAGDMLTDSTARRMELHADYLAGYYFARTDRTERSLVSFGESLFSKGDFDFNNRSHHGTPGERVTAMQAGYETANLGASLQKATRQGIDHVS